MLSTCSSQPEAEGGRVADQHPHDAQAAVPVEFAGWLPIYEHAGNCGRHPQFQHTARAPRGYRFTCSAPLLPRAAWWQQIAGWLCAGVRQALGALRLLLRPCVGVFRTGAGVGLGARLRVLAAMFRLFLTLRRRGARLIPILCFLRSRHYQSQLLLARCRGLVFLPSIPHTYGQNPWIVEIEDPTTLFNPFFHNGQTHSLRPTESPYFPIIKTLLESDQCRGIITHMQSTAALVPTLFGSDKIRRKVFHVPLGVSLPKRWHRHDQPDGSINLLFTNSWHQSPGNFRLRGGFDILEAFAILHARYPQLRLTLRTNLPLLEPYQHRIIEEGWVRVINRFMTAEELGDLMAESHIYLLPAARIHIVSLLQAMSYGLAVVASDGWGFAEYVDHERNGLMVKGRYGKVSWADEQVGLLREDYEPLFDPDPEVVQGLVEAVSRLVEDPELRQRLGHNARRDVETIYNLERWNAGLKEVFDQANPSEPEA